MPSFIKIEQINTTFPKEMMKIKKSIALHFLKKELH